MAIDKSSYGSLNPRQKKAIAALLLCDTKTEAADKAGVTRQTLNDWLKNDPCFHSAYKEALNSILEDSKDFIITEFSKSIQTLVDTRDDEGTHKYTRMLAAKYICDYGVKFYEVMKIEDRLEALERRLDHSSNGGIPDEPGFEELNRIIGNAN